MNTETATRLKITSFFEQYSLVNFKKGELMYRPGFLYTKVSFMKIGIVRFYAVSAKGEETTISFYNPAVHGSTVFGNSPESGTYQYYLEAFTPLQAYRTPQDDYIKFIHDNSDVGMVLNADLLKVIQVMIAHIILLSTGNAYNKVAAALHNFAREFGEELDGKVFIDVKMTHEMISSLTGLSRETVTNQINKIEDQGIIGIKSSHMLVNNMNLLSKQIVT